MLNAILQLFGDIFAFAGHISGGSSFPEPLSPEEEKLCVERLEAGDEEARRLLIEHNLRLVAHIAKKYAAPKRDQDDIISIGVIGLIKAVSTFNSSKGNALATYAARCIENEILMSLRTEKKQAGEISLNEPIGVDKDGNEISLSDIMGTEADDIHNAAELNIAGEYLRGAMKLFLTPRERTVIELRYGLNGGQTVPQREIAKKLGISRSYVSRIEKKALGKLNAHITGV